jgi:hypothetical protein
MTELYEEPTGESGQDIKWAWERAREGLGWVAWKATAATLMAGGAVIGIYEAANFISLLRTGQQIAPREVADWLRSVVPASGAAESVAGVAEPLMNTANALVNTAQNTAGEETLTVLAGAVGGAVTYAGAAIAIELPTQDNFQGS